MELSVQSSDGCWIAGQLDRSEKAQSGIVVPVHGSFLQNRDGDYDSKRLWMFGSPLPSRGLFRDLSHLAGLAGYATFRYDKRASGRSEGCYASTDVSDLAQDLICIVEKLREQFVGAPIVVFGHSEGALTALMAERMGLQVNAILLNAPWVGPLEAMLNHQIKHFGRQFLCPSPQVSDLKSMPYLKALYTSIFHGNLLEKIRYTSIQKDELTLRVGGKAVYRCLTNLAKYRQYDQDLLEWVQESKARIHILQGTQDANIDVNYLSRLDGVMTRKRGELLSWDVFAGLDHSFRRALATAPVTETFALPLDRGYGERLSSLLPELSPQ